MAFFIGRDREARRAYGFDEIALVPGDVTVNPDEVDTTFQLGHVKLEIPFLASAMDSVVSPATAWKKRSCPLGAPFFFDACCESTCSRAAGKRASLWPGVPWKKTW